MDYTSYITSRNILESLGKPISVTLLFLSALLILSLIIPILRKYNRRISGVTFLVLIVGFCLLIWFHFKIYTSTALINPVNGAVISRYIVPLWIEGEKLYFWAIFLALFTYILNRRLLQPTFILCLNASFGAFLQFAILYSSPLTNPLPLFHDEFSNLFFLIGRAPLSTQIQITQQALMRMKFYYNSVYMWIHPPILFISYAALTISFLACVFMLTKRKEAIFDRVSYNYAKFGYLLLTIGILIGYPWAITAWENEPWWWSPKINMSLTMWVLYTGYLHSRIYLHRQGMWYTTAILGIICFSSLIFTYITTYLVPGIHSYG